MSIQDEGWKMKQRDDLIALKWLIMGIVLIVVTSSVIGAYKASLKPTTQLSVHMTLLDWCKSNGFTGYTCNGLQGKCECQFDVEVNEVKK